jgi:hypothetical protein
MKSANDDLYDPVPTLKDWIFGLLVTTGAVAVYVFALAVTL